MPVAGDTIAKTWPIGQRFGRLRYQGEYRRHGRRSYAARFLCDCGATTWVAIGKAHSGLTQSCGCLAKERAAALLRTHGLSKSAAEYMVWANMKTRCYNPHYFLFQHYGGRGIQVCDRWRNDFAAFYADVGPRPSGRWYLDRIDNDKGYEPGNIRWAQMLVHARNKRNVVRIDGLTLPEWAARSGVRRKTIWRRLKDGWEPMRAIWDAPRQRMVR